jgi:hypothetical protein
MSTGFDRDYTSAIFGAFGDTFKKVALLVTVPVFGHFIGFNCHQAPDLVAAVRTSGLKGVDLLNQSFDLAMMPLYWAGTMLLGLTHLSSLVYVPLFAFAVLTLWLADDEYWRGAAIILLIQPPHSWYVLCREDRGMSPGDFALSAVIIGTYEIAAIAAVIWYWRQRNSAE